MQITSTVRVLALTAAMALIGGAALAKDGGRSGSSGSGSSGSSSGSSSSGKSGSSSNSGSSSRHSESHEAHSSADAGKSHQSHGADDAPGHVSGGHGADDTAEAAHTERRRQRHTGTDDNLTASTPTPPATGTAAN